MTLAAQKAHRRVHAGKQLMQLWDRLCHLLRMRQISVEDVSNKVCPCFVLTLLPPWLVLPRQLLAAPLYGLQPSNLVLQSSELHLSALKG